ncbi:MAG: sulfurtransferase complex subunit TusB [bacterium]
METLFIFSKSPWARRDMEFWLPRVGEQDQVLLIQDAVLALSGESSSLLASLPPLQGRLWALEADLAARGIRAGGAQAVDYGGAVELILKAKRVLAL